ncbi:MAG TPA: OmpH family outer membrane protein [Puia sp.]|nr:OmpH family outer membrane protein [Puia sp.]
MKYLSTILSLVALGLIGVLFLAQRRQLDQLKKHVDEEKTAGSGFKIAYFDLDTLQAHYDYMADVKKEAADRENQMNEELSNKDRQIRQRIQEWQSKGNSMTQSENEQAQREYQDMQTKFASRKQELEQGLYKFEEEQRNKIRKTIEEFIRDYNKQKNYSYIFAYDANSFIYNKDTLFNITKDLLEGLNAQYRRSK